MTVIRRIRSGAAVAAAWAAAILPIGCATVPPGSTKGPSATQRKPLIPRVLQKDREFLSDPVMLPTQDELESILENHNRPLREGSPGGDASAGGGCGC